MTQIHYLRNVLVKSQDALFAYFMILANFCVSGSQKCLLSRELEFWQTTSWAWLWTQYFWTMTRTTMVSLTIQSLPRRRQGTVTDELYNHVEPQGIIGKNLRLLLFAPMRTWLETAGMSQSCVWSFLPSVFRFEGFSDVFIYSFGLRTIEIYKITPL